MTNTRRLRVAHVSSGLGSASGGVGAVVAALSAAQVLEGGDVRVFGLETPDWLSGDRERWHGAPAETLPICGIPRALGFAPGLVNALKRFDPDIVHLHGIWMYPGEAVRRWHCASRRPYVLSVHGMLAPVALGFSPLKKSLVRALFQDEVFRSASVLHATTLAEVDEMKAFGLHNPTFVVALGVDPTRVPTDLENEPTRRVLSLGRLHPKKGLDRLVEAWAALEGDFPDWSLDLVGPDEGGYASDLAKLIDGLGLKNAHIRGPLFGVDRDRCMAGAELFVLPTRSENFAMTVAESLMMQVPVISTTGAPWSGLNTHGCGWWIEQGVASLAKALGAAMELSDAERAEMGRRGRRWMLKEFTWAGSAAKLMELYRDVLSGKFQSG